MDTNTASQLPAPAPALTAGRSDDALADLMLAADIDSTDGSVADPLADGVAWYEDWSPRSIAGLAREHGLAYDREHDEGLRAAYLAAFAAEREAAAEPVEDDT